MLDSCALMSPPTDRVLRNLWYEGLALHARVLRDFFFTKVKKDGNRNTYDTDIVAVDYFPSPATWPYTSFTLAPYLAENKERMDCALAHLATHRIAFDKDDKNWDASTLRSEIFAKWFEFMRTLSVEDSTAAEWFRSHQRARLVPFEP